MIDTYTFLQLGLWNFRKTRQIFESVQSLKKVKSQIDVAAFV